MRVDSKTPNTYKTIKTKKTILEKGESWKITGRKGNLIGAQKDYPPEGKFEGEKKKRVQKRVGKHQGPPASKSGVSGEQAQNCGRTRADNRSQLGSRKNKEGARFLSNILITEVTVGAKSRKRLIEVGKNVSKL